MFHENNTHPRGKYKKDEFYADEIKRLLPEREYNYTPECFPDEDADCGIQEKSPSGDLQNPRRGRGD